MEGQEERVEVIWNGCVVHVAAMPASLCGGILVSCWKTNGQRRPCLKADRGRMAGFKLKGDRLVPEHNFINVIQIKPNRLVLLVNLYFSVEQD